MLCVKCILVINLIGDINILFFVNKPLLKRRFMSVKNIQKIIKDKEIDYVDLRFTDPRGKLQHVTMDAKVVDDDMLAEGIFFDGSSIAGWKAINESDMILKPDLSRPVAVSYTHLTLPTTVIV